MGEGNNPDELTMAQKLDHLIRSHARSTANGRPSYKTMAKEITVLSGENFSAAYLWLLHRGERSNPTLRHLRALARYFEVPVSYFTEDDVARSLIEEGYLADRALNKAIEDAGISTVYLRGDLSALSPQGKRMAAEMIRRLRELEEGRDSGPNPDA
ncbi:hypothetical protein ABT373_30675 [Streptomyces sp. NPDC000070]|uniref:hypothetical protein n=1 Tax=Streptomyces sp. NPDC000070 TaxID=3154240 RepID=UPI00332459E2